MIPINEVNKKHTDRDMFLRKKAITPPQFREFNDSCILDLEDNKPLAYLNLNDSIFDHLIPHLKGIDYNPSNRRSTGEGNQSILVGAVPAKVNRTSFCNVGSLLDKDSQLHYILIDEISLLLDDVMSMVFPQWHKIGMHFFKKSGIHSDYQMSDSFWTSAIINHNSQQLYHLDHSNLKNTFSAMLTFKHEMSGGYLVLPEYESIIKTSNRSLTLFYGKDIVHGVSPMKIHPRNGYRYTIVFYTMNELSKCESIKKELEKA